MILDLNDLFTDIRTGAGLADVPASQRAFMRSLNGTLGEVNPRWGTEYAPEDDGEITGSIEIENYQYNAIWHGIRFYLQQAGAWAQEPDGQAWDKFDMHIRRAITSALASETVLTRNEVEADE